MQLLVSWRSGWVVRLAVCWLALFLLVLAGRFASAQTTFAARYSNAAVSGDLTLIGNVTYHCSTTPPVAPASLPTSAQIAACTSAQSGGNVTNNATYVVPFDVDTDPATSNSSSATLNLPAGSTVLFAGLYWSGVTTNLATGAARPNVRLAVGGGASSALSATTVAAIGNDYQSFVEVTGTVRAAVAASGAGAYSGTYTVGNIASTTGPGNRASWTLVIAFRNTALPTRNLAVFDGFQKANTANPLVNIGVSGFLTPSSGTVRSVIGVVAYDGDRGTREGSAAGASLRFGPDASALSPVFNTLNPLTDVFNSTITAQGLTVSAGQNPDVALDTLGFDLDTFVPNTPLPPGSTSAVVQVAGGGGNDTILPGIITLATEIFKPNIKDSLTKTVTDINGGSLLPGDALEYELVVRNSGNDGATNLVLSDVLPAGVSYKPGSLVVTGSNAGGKSDQPGDDQAEYDAAGNRVVFRLGAGATAAAGGLVAPGEETRVRFQVTVNAELPGGTVIENTGTVSFNQQTLGTAVTHSSDSDPLVAGDQPARIVVAGPDLRLSKTHTGNAAAGGLASFTLSVSNAGPAPGFGPVTLSDSLPAGLSAVSIGGTGWTCTLAPLECRRSDALAVGASYDPVTLQVRVASGASSPQTNQAAVSSPAEAPGSAGNNTASDALVVQGPPVISLSKTVRNVTGGGAALTSVAALPGQTLEYCVTFGNTGGDAPNFNVRDTLPTSVTALSSAYGPGLAAQLTQGASVTAFTAVADSDAASLIAGQVSYVYGTLLPGQTGTLCFRARVN
ncbi:isopeptide-forming domain-containing fimbrial protein [Deinococcus sp.]|uniref:isopeptide-forming domain-containing fimbrial protein n=1 Tax=Deinococcus sp. TaxID=47478 RepID=UPI0025D3F8D4|nr:isopeptide-forming domain-containing fimbrial protein [Deinococcus sp.]